MSEILTRVEIDANTGEQTIIELTSEEIAAIQAEKAQFAEQEEARIAAEQAMQALKESARAKLVAGQPLTAEEAATIVI
jgi:hypothetical protein